MRFDGLRESVVGLVLRHAGRIDANGGSGRNRANRGHRIVGTNKLESFSLGNRFLPDSSYLARSLFPEQLGALQVSSAISGFYDSYDSHSRAASLGSSRR